MRLDAYERIGCSYARCSHELTSNLYTFHLPPGYREWRFTFGDQMREVFQNLTNNGYKVAQTEFHLEKRHVYLALMNF